MEQHSVNLMGSPSGLPIIIFGLEDRKDRWKRCGEIVKEEGLSAKLIKTKLHKDLHRGCTRDFINALQIENTLFFENDFELTKGWREVLDKAIKDLPLGWDLLYLGANLTIPPKRVTENLLRIHGAWMFHAVILSRGFISYIKKHYDVNKNWVFDEWLRRTARERKFYMTYPMISYQRRGYSDFAKKETYYDIFDNKYYKRV